MPDSVPPAGQPIALHPSDALVLVDVQHDFVSGTLAVPGAREILPMLERYVREFSRRGLPVVATRDWHPGGHCSFLDRGGPWPVHCVAGTPGAAFAAGVSIGPDAMVISKATTPERDAYSGFERTDLDRRLRELGVHRLFVGGLATDYCVLRTVLDALRLGYGVVLLADAMRAVDLKPGDGERALSEMQAAGATCVRFEDLRAATSHG